MGVPNFMEGSLISYEIGDPGVSISLDTGNSKSAEFQPTSGLLLRLMSSDVLVHLYISLLNTLGRAVEQLANETKVSSRGQSTTARSAKLQRRLDAGN